MDGLAVTVAPVPDDKPVLGNQLYVNAPLAVKGLDTAPEHIEIEFGKIVIVGNGFTVTVVAALLTEQPLALVTATE